MNKVVDGYGARDIMMATDQMASMWSAQGIRVETTCLG